MKCFVWNEREIKQWGSRFEIRKHLQFHFRQISVNCSRTSHCNFSWIVCLFSFSPPQTTHWIVIFWNQNKMYSHVILVIIPSITSITRFAWLEIQSQVVFFLSISMFVCFFFYFLSIEKIISLSMSSCLLGFTRISIGIMKRNHSNEKCAIMIFLHSLKWNKNSRDSLHLCLANSTLIFNGFG